MYSASRSERRHTVRKRIAARAYMSWQGQPHRCRTRNISINGAFVETSALAPPLGARVELIFVLPRGSVIRVHRLKARIARVTRNGAALVWARGGQETRGLTHA